jgi:hypothetical protein
VALVKATLTSDVSGLTALAITMLVIICPATCSDGAEDWAVEAAPADTTPC